MSSTAKHMNKVPAGGPSTTTPALSVAVTKPPNAPRNLDDNGQKYWREYSRAMIAAGMLFETDLATLEDLCYWESLKHRGRDELPNDTLFMEYKDEGSGKVSHTQPHAAFSNLKAIQSTIGSLRAKLGLTVRDRSGLKIDKRSNTGLRSLNNANSKDW